MSDERTHRHTITVRLTDDLNAQLRRAAIEESNTTSAVVRRLIARGLQRERRAAQRDQEQGR